MGISFPATRVSILVPQTFSGDGDDRKLEGLCGDYDGISSNEFVGYGSAQAFGNAWKNRDPCPDISTQLATYNPCEVSLRVGSVTLVIKTLARTTTTV